MFVGRKRFRNYVQQPPVIKPKLHKFCQGFCGFIPVEKSWEVWLEQPWPCGSIYQVLRRLPALSHFPKIPPLRWEHGKLNTLLMSNKIYQQYLITFISSNNDIVFVLKPNKITTESCSSLIWCTVMVMQLFHITR